jgi:hypothetical protein
MLESDRPQMTILYGAEKMCSACQLTKARIHTHTLWMFNTYCFCTATLVIQTHPSVTLNIHCLSLFTNFCLNTLSVLSVLLYMYVERKCSALSCLGCRRASMARDLALTSNLISMVHTTSGLCFCQYCPVHYMPLHGIHHTLQLDKIPLDHTLIWMFVCTALEIWTAMDV